ncbi:MAG: metallopeptidase family protein [Armatimonadetes bacterium]|nr:metallopeptidase family protein [Armatimonadota bacterium]
MRYDRAAFRAVIEETLRGVPAELRQAVDNLEFLLAEWPTPEQLGSVGLEDDDLLFGLYEGTPIPDRENDVPVLPDIITLFWGPLLEACETEEELREEIRKTILHELAHYFGFDEDRLDELGYG